MANEELIKQVAGDLSRRLLTKQSNPAPAGRPLVIFGAEADSLRAKLSELGIEFVEAADLAQVRPAPLSMPAPAPAAPAHTSCGCTSTPASTQSVQPVQSVQSVQSVQPIQSLPLPILSPTSTSLHPTQQRINYQQAPQQALSDFVEFLQTKQCTMEKGKPCDNCDICNTLGF